MTAATDSNPLWSVIQGYMDDPKHRYPPKPADLARETGISEQVLSKWKKKPVLPEAAQLMVFSHGTGVPYETLLRAALEGRRYLPPGSALSMPRGWEKLLLASESMVRYRALLSEVPDTVSDLVAADEQEQSISGEQEESETP